MQVIEKRWRLRQYAKAMVPQERERLLQLGEEAVRTLLELEEGCKAVEPLLKDTPDRSMLNLRSAALRLKALPRAQQLSEASRVLAQHAPSTGQSLMSDAKAAERVISASAEAVEHLVKVVRIDDLLYQPLADAAVEQLLIRRGYAPELLLWSSYDIPSDAEARLHFFKATVTC